MHSAWFVHRDLSTSNILLSANLEHAKVADFGTARSFASPLRSLAKDGPVSKLLYRAPEDLLEIPAEGPPTDTWSLGAIFCEMHLRRPIFRGREMKNKVLQVEQLQAISSVMGAPCESRWPAVVNSAHWPDISRTCACHMGKNELCSILEAAEGKCDRTLVDLAMAMLLYDPSKRCTASEALKYTFLE